MVFELKPISKVTNMLLNRKEYLIEITHTNSAAPNKATLTSKLANEYKVEENQIYVFNMNTFPGEHKTLANANIYNSFDDLKKIERDFVVARITGEKKSKIPRRQKKDARIKRYKMFGTLKRNMRKAAKKAEAD